MPNVVVNVIAICAILLIVGVAIFYIVNKKKKGVKCIGCPYGDSCGKKTCTCSSK